MWQEMYKAKLLERRNDAVSGGGVDKIEKQHRKGKLTARERLKLLFDDGTFQEIGAFVRSSNTEATTCHHSYAGDGVVAGFGLVYGRKVYAVAEDFTVIGGTTGEVGGAKKCRVMDMAYEAGAAFVMISDGGGARIEEGVAGLNRFGEVFYRHTRASGKIVQIAAIMGPCAGGASYAPALCDFIFMTKETGQMYITGPSVVKEVIGEEVSASDLGGAEIHEKVSGVASIVYKDDRECICGIRTLLSYMPLKNEQFEICGNIKKSESIEELIPDNQKRVYDVRKVIDRLADTGSFFEIQAEFGKSLSVGLARMNGKTIGVVASQTMTLAGAIDSDASVKAARFVRFCDCFGIPILTLVDVSGFMPGKVQEHGGIIRHGAKLLYAYCEASVPKVTLVLRKAYGGAFIALGSKSLGADIVYALPIAQIAVMGAEGAVSILYKKEILQAQNPVEVRRKREEEYRAHYMTPYAAAEKGLIDEVIMPDECRGKIYKAFLSLEEKGIMNSKKQRHGNIPL